MKIVALAGLVVLLAACGSGEVADRGPTDTPTGSGATTTPTTEPTAGTLPALDSAAPAWYFAPPTTPDPGRVGALEAALGGPVYMAGDAPQSWTFTPAAPVAATGGATDPRAVAAAIWTAAGLDAGSLTVAVSPDGLTVTGTEALANVPSPLPFLVTVDDSGNVVTASGHLAVATPAGDQARVGTAAAVGMLPSASAGDDRGEKQPSLRPDPTPAVPPLSPQPTTEPTVVDRLLPPVTGVEPTYLLTPATDGGAWLLPAYRFTFDTGDTQTVLAVAAPPGESSGPVEVPELVGLPEAEAAAAAAARGWAYRVAERDGVEQMLTADYSDQRVNVAITAGAVTRAWIG